MYLHRSLTLLLGQEAQPAQKIVEEAVAQRRLPDGKPFPHELFGLLSLSDEDLSQGPSTWFPRVERHLNQVYDALVTTQLALERNLQVSRILHVNVVTPTVNERVGSAFRSVIEELHKLCRPFGLYQVHTFLLLPDLFAAPEDEEADPLCQRAYAFDLLCRIHDLMSNSEDAGAPWEGGSPIQNLWILGSRNSEGRFLGYAEEAFRILAHFLVTYAAGDLEELTKTPSERLQYFRSFGFLQVWLPLADLEDRFTDAFALHALSRRVLPEERLEKNEIVLAVKRFCAERDLTAHHLLTRIQTDPEGLSYLVPFQPDLDADLPVAAFLERLERAARDYEDRQLLEGKETLHQRAREVFREVQEDLVQQIQRLIDARGVVYAQGFLEELLGRGPSSEVLSGPQFEESRHLGSLQEELKAQLLQDFQIPAYREELQEVQQALKNLQAEELHIQTELEALEARLAVDSSPSDSTQTLGEEAVKAAEEGPEGGSPSRARRRREEQELQTRLEALRERLEEIAAERQRLEARAQRLEEVLELAERVLEDVEARNALRQKLETEARGACQAKAEELRACEERLREVTRERSDLLHEKPLWVRRYFLHYPLIVVGGILLTLVGLLASGYVSFSKLLLNPWTWQSAGIVLAGYFVWALIRYVRAYGTRVHFLSRQIEELQGRLVTLKGELLADYRALYEGLFLQHRDNVGLAGLNTLIQGLGQMASALDGFRKRLLSWKEGVTAPPAPPAESSTSLPLLRSDTYDYFFEILIPREDLEREAERSLDPTFEGQPVSPLARKGEAGAEELLAFLKDRGRKLASRRLETLHVEDILWGEEYEELRQRAKVHPDGVERLLLGVSPAVQLREPFEVGAGYALTIGVPDAERTWMRTLLERRPDCRLFSHYNPAYISAFAVSRPFSLRDLSLFPRFGEAYVETLHRSREREGATTRRVPQHVKRALHQLEAEELLRPLSQPEEEQNQKGKEVKKKRTP